MFWEVVFWCRFQGPECLTGGINPLLFWKKCLAGKISPYCVLPCCMWGFLWDCVSACSTYLYPLLWRAIHLAFRSFLEGSDPNVPIDGMSEVEVSSESSCAAILDPISWVLIFSLCPSRSIFLYSSLALCAGKLTYLVYINELTWFLASHWPWLIGGQKS